MTSSQPGEGRSQPSPTRAGWCDDQGRKKKKKKSQGRAKNIRRKTEDRVSPNRKTAKKQGKKNALKKKQLRLVQPEKSHYNRNTQLLELIPMGMILSEPIENVVKISKILAKFPQKLKDSR
jgi:hypothetical protein